MTAVVVGIDPGLSKGSGIAVLASGQLVHASLYKPAKRQHWLYQVEDFWSRVSVACSLRPGEILAVAIELPQVYDRRNTDKRPDPNDLVDLGALAGAWAAVALAACPSAAIDLVRPAAWKGQVPKDVMERRLRAELTPDEIAIVERAAPPSRQNDIWDAVGLARWAWARLGREAQKVG